MPTIKIVKPTWLTFLSAFDCEKETIVSDLFKLLCLLPMPRPPCPRKVEGSAPVTYFKPAGKPLRDLVEVRLAADEWEALRLADHEGLYHQQAAGCMNVSRQTFDRILRRARTKVASVLVCGHALSIDLEPTPAVSGPRKKSEPPETA
jgi:predicted DNA-binding protein (UPF0251 family)